VTNNPGMQSKLALAPSVRAIDRIYTEFGGNWRGALLAQRDKWVHLIDGTPDETMVQELTEIIHKL
ncbi:hypothetical protein, partial [Vibrio vulnificus]|uniref:hypothetical protein n=1 Tax=Vibrio vulnificus TaxID=672 RepID=UPI0039B4FCAF